MQTPEKQRNKQTGKNQTMTRDVNLSMIMRSYMDRPMSKVDISRLFKLSKPTSSKITAELEELGLICPAPEGTFASNSPGVKALKYKLNADFGIIAVLDMSSVVTQLQVCDFGGKVLFETKIIDKELIRYEDIDYFCKIIDEMLVRTTTADKKLLAVCVATPCAVNKLQGKIEWSPRFEVDSKFDLFKFLSQRYPGSKILIENDVQLMMSGEIYKGFLSDGSISYALLMYVDSGLGGSFFVNGKLEDGEEGKAGDLGFLPYPNEKGEYVYLDSVISINAIKKTLTQKISEGAATCLASDRPLHFSDIKEAYFQGDSLVSEVVEKTAQKTAEALSSLIDILNLNFIIISGRITQFGEHYREIIENSLRPRFPSARVKYSQIQNSAIHEGAMLISSQKVIEDIISHRTKKAQ